MSSMTGASPLIRPEDLGRALEVVAEALHAPEATLRFQAAVLYLETARLSREFPSSSTAAVTLPEGHVNGTEPAPVAWRPAADHPWRARRRLSQTKGARLAREYRRRIKAKGEEKTERPIAPAASGLTRGGRWPRASGIAAEERVSDDE